MRCRPSCLAAQSVQSTVMFGLDGLGRHLHQTALTYFCALRRAQAQKQAYAKQDLEGVPYNVYERGPPLPPCNRVRAVILSCEAVG